MIFNIIMLLCMYPILPIMYFVLKNEAKPKKNIILGVTLPHIAREDSRVHVILDEFKSSLGKYTLILAVIPFINFLIPYMSINLTIYMTWMVIAIIIPYLIFIKYHKKIKEFKKENGWNKRANVTLIDTKVSTKIELNKVKRIWFIPPILISFIPVIASILSWIQGKDMEYGYTFIIIYLLNAFLTICFLPINELIYRQRSEVIDSNSDMSLALTRIRRNNWSKSLILSAWLTGIFSLLFWRFIWNGIAILIVTGIYSIILLYYIMRAEFKTRAMQEKLTKDSGMDIYLDDDDYWIYGILYYNPNDKHLIINDRIGMGTSVNLAKTSGKILMMFSAICILLMPFLGIWVMIEEFTPITVSLFNESILVDHTKRVLEVDLEDIESIDLINTLPERYKIAGSSMDNLLKGKFVVEGYGDVRLYLNPKEPPYITITTSEGTYIIGSNESESTMEVYEELLNKQKN